MGAGERQLSLENYVAVFAELTQVGMSAASGYVVSHMDELKGALSRFHTARGGGATKAHQEETARLFLEAIRYEVQRRVIEFMKSDPPTREDLADQLAALAVDAVRTLFVKHNEN